VGVPQEAAKEQCAPLRLSLLVHQRNEQLGDGNSNDGSGDERLHFELGDDLLLPAHLRSRAMSNHQIRNLSQTLHAEVQRPTGGIEAAASIQHPCNSLASEF